MSRVTLDLTNRDDILWLQMALSRLTFGRQGMTVGEIDPLTTKALIIFQMQNDLPVTGEADEATLGRINAELQERGITI